MNRTDLQRRSALPSAALSLSAPGLRERLHDRTYEFSGYLRADGRFDIEGRMFDAKTYAFPNAWRGEVHPGQPVHDMLIRLTLNRDFTIEAVEALTAAAPFSVCGDIAPAFAALKGRTLAKGWSATLKSLFAGVHGCTHHVEMLRAMGTVAFQTIYGWKEKEKRDAGASKNEGPPAESLPAKSLPGRKPAFLDTCYALSSAGETVRQHWPQFFVAKQD
jgi:Protein of unknown function (DUF2889)